MTTINVQEPVIALSFPVFWNFQFNKKKNQTNKEDSKPKNQADIIIGQLKRHKFAYLTMTNNGFTPFARAFFCS